MKTIMFKAIGKKFTKMRNDQGLTQQAVANELGYATAQFVSNFERGLCGPPVHQLPKLVKLYNLDSLKLHKFLVKQHSEYLRKAMKL